MILASGLITSNEDGSKKYDRFRGRIIFPIFSSHGKVIAFGGRIMGSDKGVAKYLNSPETDLFKKGYTLYGFNFAKDMSYKQQKIMVVEGYMDVIALHQAGFEYTVAPLGTALTENHIRQLWKVSKEPIICLDGDIAGQRASKKFAEEYIKLLEPGYTIKFVFVPKGYDPDEFIKEQGSLALDSIINSSKPLSDALWDINYSEVSLDTPEQKSAFAKKITDIVATIQNQSVRDFYKREYADRIYRLGYVNSSNSKNLKNSKIQKTFITPGLKSSLSKNYSKLEGLKERLILVISYNPSLLFLQEVEEVVTNMEIDNKLVEKLAETAINFCASTERTKVNFNGFILYLEKASSQNHIDYLRSNVFKDEYLWQDNASNKAIYAWRYLLAEYYLCLAERKRDKLHEMSGVDISILFEKQQEIQSQIADLVRNRDERREEFEEIANNN